MEVVGDAGGEEGGERWGPRKGGKARGGQPGKCASLLTMCTGGWRGMQRRAGCCLLQHNVRSTVHRGVVPAKHGIWEHCSLREKHNRAVLCTVLLPSAIVVLSAGCHMCSWATQSWHPLQLTPRQLCAFSAAGHRPT